MILCLLKLLWIKQNQNLKSFPSNLNLAGQTVPDKLLYSQTSACIFTSEPFLPPSSRGAEPDGSIRPPCPPRPPVTERWRVRVQRATPTQSSTAHTNPPLQVRCPHSRHHTSTEGDLCHTDTVLMSTLLPPQTAQGEGRNQT